MKNLNSPNSFVNEISSSHRAYYVKKQTTVPSGDKNDPQILEQPWYWVMRRPVNPQGERCGFYGTKTVKFKGPFVGATGKDTAEKIAFNYNEAFHSCR